jgi:GTP-binding protein Era
MTDESPSPTATRCGTVAIIGRPNAGKSTLLNAILGLKLSIVTDKPQTTRKRVLGIHTTDTAQLIFVDTPGVIQPRYKLQRSMMGFVDETMSEADVICVVVDAVKAIKRGSIRDPMVERRFASGKIPAILVLNKMDAVGVKIGVLPLLAEAQESGIYKKAIAIAARDNTYVTDLVEMLTVLAPEGDFLYDPDQLSTLPERFFVAELIREAIFEQFREEVPYATDVEVREFKEREEGKWYVLADIVVERDTQKAIIIGAKGSALKQIGETARAAIEQHLDHPVYLELYVKVKQGWRDDKNQLNNLGY